MALQPVGREEELRALGAFVERARSGAHGAAVLLEGEPGVGKSTLWDAGVEAAAAAGARVLTARPSEAEGSFA